MFCILHECLRVSILCTLYVYAGYVGPPKFSNAPSSAGKSWKVLRASGEDDVQVTTPKQPLPGHLSLMGWVQGLGFRVLTS